MRWPHGRRLWIRCKFLHGMVISLYFTKWTPNSLLWTSISPVPQQPTSLHIFCDKPESSSVLWHWCQHLRSSLLSFSLPHFHFWFWKWFCMLQSFLLWSLSREIDCLIALEATRFICQRNVFFMAETLLRKASGLGYGTSLGFRIWNQCRG